MKATRSSVLQLTVDQVVLRRDEHSVSGASRIASTDPHEFPAQRSGLAFHACLVHQQFPMHRHNIVEGDRAGEPQGSSHGTNVADYGSRVQGGPPAELGQCELLR